MTTPQNSPLGDPDVPMGGRPSDPRPAMGEHGFNPQTVGGAPLPPPDPAGTTAAPVTSAGVVAQPRRPVWKTVLGVICVVWAVLAVLGTLGSLGNGTLSRQLAAASADPGRMVGFVIGFLLMIVLPIVLAVVFLKKPKRTA